MKASNHFKNTIKAYLDKRSETDILFSFRYTLPQKNIDDCVTYILNTVHKSGCNGFEDDEIYSMAVHYYDEDNINIGKPINANIVVNHVVKLTEEEKEQARQNAIQQVQNEAYKRMIQPKKAKKIEQVTQPCLFEF